MSIIIRQFRIVWKPTYPWQNLGPKVYVELEVTEPVVIKKGVSGYFIDGRPYEIVEEDTPVEPGVYRGEEGPFTFKYFPYLPWHTIEIRLVWEGGEARASARYYIPVETALVTLVISSGIIGGITIFRRLKNESQRSHHHLK